MPPNANPLVNERAMSVIEEKVAVLNGDRGDVTMHALRQVHLTAVREALAGLIKRANNLSATFDSIQGDVATLKSQLEEIKVQVEALNAALPSIESRLDAIELITADIGTALPAVVGDSMIYQT